MTPTTYRAGGANMEIRLPSANAPSGRSSWPQATGASSPISGRQSDELACDLQDQFSRANLIGGDAEFEETGLPRWLALSKRPVLLRLAAGHAAANDLAVAIPCHRVVRNDGGLSSYRWGVERKRALLEKEAHA